ncbi:MAG: hypothetical protein QXH17_08135 [Candidatus Bathyarchaeia archaeon]
METKNRGNWTYTGIWSGNHQGMSSFDLNWYERHVFDIKGKGKR